MPFLSREVTLAHHNLETIKSYVNLKDRTEKDSIDPLSSITSALAKVGKNDIGTCIIDFSPIADHTWRTDGKKHILSSSSIPNSMKLHLLHFWGYIGWLFFPIIISLWVVRFLMPRNTDEHNEKNEHIEEKTESFGYRVHIMLGKNIRESIADNLFLKELSGSMNIFANPSGNSFLMKKPRKGVLHSLPKKLSHTTSILNTTELAGLIHLPTLYVKTPGINWVTTRRFEPPHNLPSTDSPNTPIGMANYRGQSTEF